MTIILQYVIRVPNNKFRSLMLEYLISEVKSFKGDDTANFKMFKDLVNKFIKERIEKTKKSEEEFSKQLSIQLSTKSKLTPAQKIELQKKKVVQLNISELTPAQKIELQSMIDTKLKPYIQNCFITELNTLYKRYNKIFKKGQQNVGSIDEFYSVLSQYVVPIINKENIVSATNSFIPLYNYFIADRTIALNSAMYFVTNVYFKGNTNITEFKEKMSDLLKKIIGYLKHMKASSQITSKTSFIVETLKT